MTNMAARKSQFVLGTLGCLIGGILDVFGLSTSHWTLVGNSTIGIWTCYHGNEKEISTEEREVDCDRLTWESLPMYLIIVRILAILTMVFFLISLAGLLTGCLCAQSSSPSNGTGFLLARLQELGTMIGSLLTLLLVAVYVTNHKELVEPEEDPDVSVGYSFVLSVTGLGIGLVSAINLCCARGYRDYQRVQKKKKKNVQRSPFADY